MSHAIHGRPRLHRSWVLLAVVLVVASLLRLWSLQQIPPGLFGDEATDGLDALDVLAGHGAVFFPANYGREGLHMWIIAAFFRLFGVVPLALRLPSALAGILTAGATFWLGIELTRAGLLCHESKRGRGADFLPSLVGAIAALYLATSYWHLHFSRFGIRGVFTPLCGALAFAAFWHAVNARTGPLDDGAPPERSSRPGWSGWQWYALSGALLGLGTYFYTASRFLPFFLAGFLLVQWLISACGRRHEDAILRRDLRGIVLMYAVALLVFAPLGLYFLQHPGSFSQRASEVVAFGESGSLQRVFEAAAANALQFFLPGRGDTAQFYNLPGRAVFDPITAILAVVGIVVLLWRFRRPASLFLLLWWPALLLPSFLATDRFPTLPRVLGVIPGVYFFPAIGLLSLLYAFLRPPRWLRGHPSPGESDPARPAALQRLLAATVLVGALVIHAGLTMRDYFSAWGPSQATFDAFEGDMTAAWEWLDLHPTTDHVYLSSDIYRHPTFMLLGEHATVRTYFDQSDPDLSWFDARAAWPLPPPGESALYLITGGTPLEGPAAPLAGDCELVDRLDSPDGSAALQVLRYARELVLPLSLAQTIPFGSRLELTGAAWDGSATSGRVLLLWRTSGADPAAWSGYRLEFAGEDWTSSEPFEAFRPPEWVMEGRFLTWHSLRSPSVPSAPLRMRLVDAATGEPLVSQTAPGGWVSVEW